jgi:uncharacterized protein
MGVIDGRTWLELLSPQECGRLLAGERFGRLAYLLEGRPEILPVNFAFDGTAVLFRTDTGTKLEALETHPEVAFEIDAFDREHDTGWSVLIVGRAVEVPMSEAEASPAAAAVRPAALGDKQHWFRIVPERISGRRVVRGAGG